MLRVISPSQKANAVQLHSREGPRGVSLRYKRRMVVARDWGEEGMGNLWLITTNAIEQCT